jgi:5-methylthioadenosine/S-adenosylhomocysteine deaminase
VTTPRPVDLPVDLIVDLIICHGIVVTMDPQRRVLADGAIAIRDGRIVAVDDAATVLAAYSASEHIDASGQVVHPGLINGHTHGPMELFRGLADDELLDDWLQHTIFPAEALNVDEAFVRTGMRLALAEMIRGGISTFADMYYFEAAVADETAQAGMRAVLGQVVIDFPAPDNANQSEAMACVDRFVGTWQGHRLITPAIAPHAPYTVCDAHLQQVQALAERRSCPVVMHVAETRHERDDCLRQHGCSPVQHLQGIGLLSERLIAAHMVWTDAADLEQVRQHGVGLVHNPQSNMKLASGIAPLPAMLSLDLPVGLGTDSSASNNALSLWDEMNSAAKLHKVIHEDPKVVSAREAFEMATIRGAASLHLENEIGSLEVGKRADIAIVAMDPINQTPLASLYSALVYDTKANDVRDLIVEGRPILRHRQLLTLDETQIGAEGLRVRQQVVQRLGLQP